MPPFKTSLCRTPGGFLTLPHFSGTDAQVENLAQFSLMAVLFAVLPAMLYWQHRRRRWWTMGAGLTAFILMLDHLMLKDRGSIWQTMAATGILCGPSYLALTALWAALRRIGRVMGGGRAAPLSLSDCIVIALLAIVAHLLFFIAATIADVASTALLNAVGDFINCLYHLARPVNIRSHGDQLNMLFAALPALLLATLLQAWLRRRRAILPQTSLLLPR